MEMNSQLIWQRTPLQSPTELTFIGESFRGHASNINEGLLCYIIIIIYDSTWF